MPHLLATLIYLSKNYSYYIRGDRSPLSKAFDSVDHSILLKTIFKYATRGSALKWMTDYLKERQKYVLFNIHCSSNAIVFVVYRKAQY